MSKESIDQDIRPISEFGTNAATFIDQVRQSKKPIIITQDGKNAAVLLDVVEYEGLIEKIEILQDIRQAEVELREGKGVGHEAAKEKILARLRK